MKNILFIIFLLNINLFSIDLPNIYDTNIDNIEYNEKNSKLLDIENKKRINIITSKNINIPIKYDLPYRSIDNSKMKVIGNVVKIYNQNKIEIINKDILIKQNNLFNKYLDDFINALKNSQKDRVKYSGCISILDYYKDKSNSCFKLMKMMNNQEKEKLNNVINKIVGR